MKELDHNQIIAIEEFVNDLRECYVAKGDNYAVQILDLHLSLAHLKFDYYVNNHSAGVNR